MSPGPVFKLISLILLVIACFMFVPAFIAFSYNEAHVLRAFLITIIVMLILAGTLFFALRRRKIVTLSTRDGFLFVTLSWVIASLFGALPFYLSESIPTFTDAFFESISGFSTTGASILTTIESLPRALLFWRSLTHWLGGMGIVVLTVAILPLLGVGGLQLIRAEAPGPTVDKITPRMGETAKILWKLYIGFTIAETLLLMMGGLSLFDALTHTFGTLATGGFSPKNLSVGHYHSAYVDGVVTLFMIIAGINFSLHYRLLTGTIKPLLRDNEFKTYITIFLISTVIITFSLYGEVYQSLGTCLRFASFQAAAILTTTGYASANFEQWPFIAQSVLFILMFVGGCSGSTGGGIKVIRILTLFKTAYHEMKHLIHPRGVFSLRIGSRIIKKDISYAIAGFFFLYIAMVLMVTFIVALSGEDILTAVTTALATIGNIGPGFGKIGPAENYAFYPAFVKWVLCFAMLAGRLELYTVLVIFTPAFWRR
jgi:trk system potassium uptake protein TrkH